MTVCPVCLEEKTVGSTSFPCQHFICPPCAEKWLAIKTICPLCRRNALPGTPFSFKDLLYLVWDGMSLLLRVYFMLNGE